METEANIKTEGWKKSERFAIISAIYETFLLDDTKTENKIEGQEDIEVVNFNFILENSIYEKSDSESANIKKVKQIFSIFLENSVLYESKVKQYLSSYKTTPAVVRAILATLFLELDEILATYPDALAQDGLPYNFLGKYPRITQELIAGEYTALINAIVRRISIDNKLKFKSV
jgi:hypothetical protein